jgi:UDP-glucose 4-epimerase
MLQLIHEDDVIDALTHVVFRPIPGVFNVAAPGAMPLSRIIALSGKRPLPVMHSLVCWGVQASRRSGVDAERYAPIDPDYLRYSWVADLSKMEEQLGFAPRYTAEEALREFAARHHRRRAPEYAAVDEKRLRATLERRRKQENEGSR